MQIAHVILAHKNPLQVRRLVLQLIHPESIILLHVDRKTDLGPFKKLLQMSNIHFVKRRVDVNWGGFSQVEAVMNSFKELIQIAPDVSYVNLLSGQDYPIKTLKDFHEFLSINPKRAFMEFLPVDHEWVVAARARFNKYHFTDIRFFGKHKLEELITVLLPKRLFPVDFKLTGKSQWFTIDNECLRYIIWFSANNKGLYNKFKYSWGADELVFQSILFNSPLKEKLVNNNLRYIDWSENQSSPKILTTEDQTNLIGSTAFFARKFDVKTCPGILDFIDENLLKT